MSWQAFQAHLLIELQTELGHKWDGLTIALSWLGNYTTYLYLVTALIIIMGTDFALETGILALLAMVSADVLKLLFLTQRPYETAFPIRSLYQDSAAGASFPSGHAEVATAVYAHFAFFLRRRAYPWWGLLLVIPVLIGFSRLYLGVHWPIDVFSGWVFGWVLFELTIRRPGILGSRHHFGILSPLWWMIILLISTISHFGLDTTDMLRFVATFSLSAYFAPAIGVVTSARHLLLRSVFVIVPMLLMQLTLRDIPLNDVHPLLMMAFGGWLGMVGFVFQCVKI